MQSERFFSIYKGFFSMMIAVVYIYCKNGSLLIVCAKQY